MHLPFTPNHVQLIAACYPPNAALLTSGPEYRPNSQELSRLTYYASNRPGKINKLAGELEKRVKVDCKKAQAGNIRARASLLISLAIFKALATECRRDISLLSGSLLSSINATLTSLRTDLEVAARVASVFNAWTTYTDGHLIGVDKSVTEEYMSCLQMLAHMGRVDSPSLDHEIKRRTRLLGTMVILGVVTSEALYYSSNQFSSQISTIMPALIIPLLDVDVSTLNHEAARNKDQPLSPHLDNWRDRPTIERRAASIHLHVDGDKGPSSSEIAKTAIHALSILLAHAVAFQASTIVRAIFDCLDDTGGWEKMDHCEWIAIKAAEWTQYQYRYTIPSRLVESLVEGQDAPHSTPRHKALAAMVKTVFTSPTPLINLTLSEIISSLIGVILRRVTVQPDDPLLPLLVECISSLGTHIYYADQIQDLATELISRLALVETNGLGGDKSTSEKCRPQALRCLLASLLGLIQAADRHDSAREDAEELKMRKSISGSVPSSPNPNDVHIKPSRRTKVPPEVWQETMTLLCDADYSVRADYAEALVFYLKHEIPKLGDHTDEDGVRRTHPLVDGPARQASLVNAVMYGDATIRFLNALYAHLHLLATSSVLGMNTRSPFTTPARSVNEDGTTSQDDSRDNSRRNTAIPPRTRKTSVMLRVLQTAPRDVSPATSSKSASLSDYANILTILTTVQECLPVRGLLTAVPMLVAMDKVCVAGKDTDADLSLRLRVIKELVAKAWLSLGKVWNCQDVVNLAQEALESTQSIIEPTVVSEPSTPEIKPPREATSLSTVNWDNTDISLNTEAVLSALASSSTVQEATGLDQQELERRFTSPWTPEVALKELEVQTSYDPLNHDTITSLTRKKGPALMQIENMSLQSLARSHRGGVGVTDLREALEGRSSMSNPNLSNRAPSFSTLEHTSTLAHGDISINKLTPVRSRPQQRSKLSGPSDVRDVLNKLGIGKQNGGIYLKPSFPSQKPDTRPPVPPYKT
ncbi:hypothetical protein QCA50_000609 [Cerrena zonata]|uniref:Protein EFR3 n=1 Tax=Cerrena zonata TaxID=2478898 RepID=A0AAW0GRW5_9APHY